MPAHRRLDAVTGEPVNLRWFGGRIPEQLALEFDALLVDPRNGRSRYGTRAQIIEGMVRRWIDEQKAL